VMRVLSDDMENLGISIDFDGYRIYNPKHPKFGVNYKMEYRFSDPSFRLTAGDVYLSDHPSTAFFEVREYSAGKNLYRGRIEVDNVLDLTDANVLKRYGIDATRLRTQVEIDQFVYQYTNGIANRAFTKGYNGILFPSAQLPGGTNLMIFNNAKFKATEIFDVPIGNVGR